MSAETEEWNYRDESARMRTALATIRTLEAIRRSKLAELRTGISVVAISLSIFTVLITTSSLWNPATLLYLYIVVVISLIFLMIVGIYLFYHGLRGMQAIDKRREKLSKNIESLNDMFEEIMINFHIYITPLLH